MDWCDAFIHIITIFLHLSLCFIASLFCGHPELFSNLVELISSLSKYPPPPPPPTTTTSEAALKAGALLFCSDLMNRTTDRYLWDWQRTQRFMQILFIFTAPTHQPVGMKCHKESELALIITLISFSFSLLYFLDIPTFKQPYLAKQILHFLWWLQTKQASSKRAKNKQQECRPIFGVSHLQ